MTIHHENKTSPPLFLNAFNPRSTKPFTNKYGWWDRVNNRDHSLRLQWLLSLDLHKSRKKVQP